NTERRRSRVEDVLHLRRGKQARRAATEKDGLQRALMRQRLPGTDLSADRCDIALVPGCMPGQDSEGAIRATLRAEGDMHVKAKGLGRGNHVSIFSAAKKASCGISTFPSCFMRFLPSFCLLSSLRLRVMSPP